MSLARRVFGLIRWSPSLRFRSFSQAQTERGAISGLVTDETKAGVPGVAVKVINTGTNVATNRHLVRLGHLQRAKSPARHLSRRGHARRVPDLNRRRHHRDGRRHRARRRHAEPRLDGRVGERRRRDHARCTPKTRSRRPAVSNKLIDELPLVVGGAMRSPFDLIATVPEASGSGGNVSLGGGQGGAFGATLDGVSVNTNRNADTAETAFLTPSLEAITEFSVETNGFKPEFGQAGGGVITFASKSGTNILQRLGLRVPPQRRARRARLLRAHEGHLQAERLRRVARRSGADSAPLRRHEPHVLLRVVRRVPQPRGQQRRVPQRADAGNVERRLLELGRRQGRRLIDLRPGDDQAEPERRRDSSAIRSRTTRFRVERFSTVAKQYIALARSALVPNRPGLVPGTFGYVNNNYVSEGRSTHRERRTSSA